MHTVTLVPEEWLPGGDIITHKIIRYKLRERYKAEVAAMTKELTVP
jgi:hypothetical protein